jgi:hypothetical protein
MRLTFNADPCQSLLRSIDELLGTGSLPLLLMSCYRDPPCRGRPDAVHALAVAAHDVQLHAQQPRKLTGTVQRPLGSV